MVWTKFILKILAAMLGPTLLALVLTRLWSRFYQSPCRKDPICSGIYPYEPNFTEQVFTVFILGLFLLSIVLPILLTIRDIQRIRSLNESTSVINLENETLWR